MSDWYLYLIRCRDNTLYTGISTDVGRRLAQHRGAGNTGSKYLNGRGPLRLVLKEERRVKRMSKAKKEELIKVSGYALTIECRVER